MYPLIRVGPLGLSSSGLLLLAGVLLAGWLLGRRAATRADERLAHDAEHFFYAALVGAVFGGRLWYGLLNMDLYRQSPALLLAPRLEALAWPGAILGGLGLGFAWLWLRGRAVAPAADQAARVLPLAQALGSVGLLLSGEALGRPTALPWGVPMLGASRHPTQLYFALAALLTAALIVWLSRQQLPSGALLAAYVAANGLALIAFDPLRADVSLLPGGVRLNQVVGLGVLLAAAGWARTWLAADAQPADAGVPTPDRAQS